MKVTNQYDLPVSSQEVWPYLQDPQMLRRILPGCTELQQTAVNQYQGQIAIQHGPIKGQYAGTITLTNIQEATGYDVELTGTGDSSFIRGKGHVQLIEQNESTAVQFEGQAEVGGRLASVSNRLLTTTANSLIRRSLEALEQEIVPQNGTTAVAPAPSANGHHQPAPVVERIATKSENRIVLIGLTLGLIGAVGTTSFFLILRQIYRWWVNRLTKRIIAELQSQSKD